MTVKNMPPSPSLSAQQPPRPPVAKRVSVTLEQLGRTRNDAYGWMKDENWQKVLRDPSVLRADIRQHLEAENIYCTSMLQNTQDLQKTLFDEMVGRIPPSEHSVPLPDGPWLYGLRYEEGGQHPLHIRTPRNNEGAEEILLDVNKLAKAHKFYSLACAAHSDDHNFYVYAEDIQGSEIFQIQIKDLRTGQICAPAVQSSTGRFTLSPDSQFLFWIYRDDHGRPSKIYRRPLLGGDDVLVYHEQDPGFFLSIGVSASRQWIIIERGNHDTNESLLIPTHTPTALPKIAAPLVQGERYSLIHWQTDGTKEADDGFIILTNKDGATDFKLMQTPVNATEQAHWRDFLPHQQGHFLQHVAVGRHGLVWSELYNGNTQIFVLPASERHQPIKAGASEDLRQKAYCIAMDEPAYDLGLLGILEYDQPVLRYTYQSPTQPAQWYDYNINTRERLLRKTRQVPSGHHPGDYETRRLFATAHDGAEVPVTLLMRKGTALDGSAPLLLYGYGSYGISMEASFSTTALSLVDRGWIYAIAHIRGGTEKGWTWFLDGRGKKKTNSFTDFIACAHMLVAQDYTAKGRIIAHGGSAGGLLMGAVANMEPELFGGIAAQVPFVDMLNTMSDISLPLTPPEWPEWGNPLTDPEAYDLIASYSPYDNIRPAASGVSYPPILAMGGLADPRVTYWEPAKWIAKLRETAKGGPFLCRINMEAGHGGASGRFERLRETALVQAFALWCMENSCQ